MRPIDADALMKRLKKDPLYPLVERYNIDGFINAEPTVDAVPVVHGRWKAVTEDMVTYKRICSCCGKEAPYDMRDEDPLSEGYYMLYPYCPMCGAKMDGRDGDGNG